jgi:hypothetical protein
MTVVSVRSLSVQYVLSVDLTLTIIDVIKLEMGIFRVIDNQGTAQAITILILEMAVVPVCPLQNTKDEAPESV